MPRAASTRAAAAANSRVRPKERAEQTREIHAQASAGTASNSKGLRSKDKNVPASSVAAAPVLVADANVEQVGKGKGKTVKPATTSLQGSAIVTSTTSRVTRGKNIHATEVPASKESTQLAPRAEPSGRATRQRSKAAAQPDVRHPLPSRTASTARSRAGALKKQAVSASRKHSSSSSAVLASAPESTRESEEIPSTPPHLRWMREELGAQEGSAEDQEIGSTPPHVKWTAEEREEIEREAGELLRAAEQRVRLASSEGDKDAAETEERATSEREASAMSDKENLDPSSGQLQRQQQQQQQQQQQVVTHRNRARHTSSASEPDLSLEPHNSLGLADKEPQHSTPLAEKVKEKDGRRKVDLARVQSVRKPLREIVLAREEGAKRQGTKKQEKQTLDELLGLRDESRSASRIQQRQRKDEEATFEEREEQKDPYRAAQDPHRLQRWIAAHAGGRNAAADEPPPPPPLDQGMTQSEDALEREAQDQSCTTLQSYQPSWLLRNRQDAAYDSVDEDFERRKRRKVAERYEAQEDDDPFGILLEVRQTARVERRKGLLYRPSPPVQRRDQRVLATPSRRQNAREEPPMKEEHATLPAASSPLSSVLSSKELLLALSPLKNTIKDSSSSDKENSKPLSSVHMEELVELLPKRAPRRTRLAPATNLGRGKKVSKGGAEQGKRVASGKGKAAKKDRRTRATKGFKKALSDSESGEEEEDLRSAEETEEEEEEQQVKKQKALRKSRSGNSKQVVEDSSPSLSPKAETERKRRLEYYRSLQDYDMKEELVL